MSLANNKNIVQKSFEVVWNQHNIEAIDEYYASDYEAHNQLPGVTPDRRGLKNWVNLTTRAFPDIEFKIKDQFAEKDEVVTRWEAHGTQNGEFMGVPATGKEVMVTGLTVSRVKDGKIKEAWLEWDSLSLMQQLGMFPDAEG